MSITADDISKHLVTLGDTAIAKHSQRFFKTGKGEYGEGDQFLGIRVPVIRKQVKKYKAVSLAVTAALLGASFHEVRLFSVLMLVSKFSKGDETEKSKIYHLYIENIQHVNNWNLVDISAGPIIGAYDRITPASVVRQVARKYKSVSTYKAFENHAHWVIAEPGWQEIAKYVTSWLGQALIKA